MMAILNGATGATAASVGYPTYLFREGQSGAPYSREGAFGSTFGGVRDLLKEAFGHHPSTRPPRLQFPRKFSYIFKHKYPQRLDYLFFCDSGCVRPGAAPLTPKLVPFSVARDGRASYSYTHLSDHYGIASTLRIENDFLWRDASVSSTIDASASAVGGDDGSVAAPPTRRRVDDSRIMTLLRGMLAHLAATLDQILLSVWQPTLPSFRGRRGFILISAIGASVAVLAIAVRALNTSLLAQQSYREVVFSTSPPPIFSLHDFVVTTLIFALLLSSLSASFPRHEHEPIDTSRDALRRADGLVAGSPLLAPSPSAKCVGALATSGSIPTASPACSNWRGNNKAASASRASSQVLVGGAGATLSRAHSGSRTSLSSRLSLSILLDENSRSAPDAEAMPVATTQLCRASHEEEGAKRGSEARIGSNGGREGVHPSKCWSDEVHITEVQIDGASTLLPGVNTRTSESAGAEGAAARGTKFSSLAGQRSAIEVTATAGPTREDRGILETDQDDSCDDLSVIHRSPLAESELVCDDEELGVSTMYEALLSAVYRFGHRPCFGVRRPLPEGRCISLPQRCAPGF